MKLLLDTHVLLWCALEPERLSRSARTAIEDSENEVYVSAVSAWEETPQASNGGLATTATFIVTLGRSHIGEVNDTGHSAPV
jgi:PIN domain nuclease of toxin-antitoxin system